MDYRISIREVMLVEAVLDSGHSPPIFWNAGMRA
jgi:hypoxanthine-guanine phosphoribosyltransferase